MTYEAWVGICCFLGMLALILIGVPIFISMFTAAFVGFWLVGGLGYALLQFRQAPYYISDTYVFGVVPMFILMGIIAGECGLAEDIYTAMSKWFGGLRGGILMATIAGAGVFGACTGTSLASAAVFTRISLPELESHKFDKSLSMGAIAASGAMASLIPPSVPIVIFCVLAESSIGKALVGGIIPGIILTLVLMGIVTLLARIYPQKIPAIHVRHTWRERFSSVRMLWPVLCLFLLVVGGMYAGWFPATTGGAIGAAGVLVYALFRRIQKRTLYKCFWEMAIVNVQLFPIIIGGYLFGRFLARSGLAARLLDLIAQSGLSPLTIMWIVILIYIFLGCVMELFSLLIITVPLLWPILQGLGFDPVQICIILVLVASIATITPPIGVVVFLVSSIARVDSSLVFRGVMPYFIGTIAVMTAIVFFPPLATWLPKLLY
jgi:C4-dicarboxylate transporter DctM subunit